MPIQTSVGTIDLDARPRPTITDVNGFARQLTEVEAALAHLLSGNPSPSAAPAKAKPDDKINLNHAAKPVLILLPGVGEKTAQKIIDARPLESFHSLETLEIELTSETKKLVSF